jgi:hypothetical protein
MIRQIATVKTKTQPLPVVNQTRDKAEPIHSDLEKEQAAAGESLPTEGYLFSPIHAGPYLVPITRWIE